MSHVILLISDDKSTDQALRGALMNTTPVCELRSADRREAVRALPAPAVILLDLMLSRDPAFDVLRWLRAEDVYRHVPVFVLGSEIIDHEVNEAYALGANACLLKRSTSEGLAPIAQGIAAYASLLPNPGLAL
jgi:DNA-binding NarL/FixJ family response regulator